ncbi:MAG: alkyl hydroperoxide reductase subunit F [Oligoflexia bacterium]|nr:alkyl hydroperoxide reductase subunit F [Oligoflexia bacterium]
MLDTQLQEQLQGIFASLETRITLLHDESDHANQGELLAMLHGLAAVSSRIGVASSGKRSGFPRFELLRGDSAARVHFKGVPGGHEFSSLVLAILNADGKGKLPDASLTDRIRRLQGPIRLRTFVSLSCENCPDVVQSLNLMALLHEDFVHEMVDGAYAQDELSLLGIQGVPAVVAGSKLLHSGRGTLLELLERLEKSFGSDGARQSPPQALDDCDVAIIGGGPAGASAAIYSARKGLKTVLLAERMGGQVQDTKGIENLISVTYTEGPRVSAQLREHLAAYPVSTYEQRRVSRIEPDGGRNRILLEGGEFLSARQVIIATGAKWRELDVPGEKEYLGRGVAFCPHCDGPFYKGKRVAVIGGGNSGVEAAIDLAGIVREVVLFEFQEELKADQILVDKLKSLPNASIVTGARTTQVLGDGQRVIALEYEQRASAELKRIDLDGVFVQIGLLPNSGFLKGTVELTRTGEIIVDAKGRTSAPGIYAAGDVTTTPYKQIVIAMGEGAKAALAAFEDRMRANGA